jgi:hypothetical protein
MNRPTLPTLEQSKSAYSLLRTASQCGYIGVGVHRSWFAMAELDAYAKALAAFKLLSVVSNDLHDNYGPRDNLAMQAKSALCAVAELESSLAAFLMVRDAEELVLAAEQAEQDDEQAEQDELDANRSRLTGMT